MLVITVQFNLLLVNECLSGTDSCFVSTHYCTKVQNSFHSMPQRTEGIVVFVFTFFLVHDMQEQFLLKQRHHVVSCEDVLIDAAC